MTKKLHRELQGRNNNIRRVPADVYDAPMPNPKTVPNIIARRMVEMGVSDRKLASVVGCEGPSIMRWRRGTQAPNAKYLPALAEALGVTVEALVAGLVGA